MQYVITRNQNIRCVDIFDPQTGESYIILDDNPSIDFDELVAKLLSQDFEGALELIEQPQQIQEEFLNLTDSMTIKGDRVFYGHEELFGTFAQHIVDFHSRGIDKLKRLVTFADKLMQNPSFNSRRQLYEFLEMHDLWINENGNFIAFKGVNADYTSIHAGYGIVDGVEHVNNHLPNGVGSIVEVPRNMVDDNINNGCSFGLHAGTWEYASSFARGATMTVEIDPADVVSVPNDSNHQKIRVCKYKVLEVREHKMDETFYEDDDWYDDTWSSDDNDMGYSFYEEDDLDEDYPNDTDHHLA